ncbi:MAG: CoA-binding protein [Candidatus Zixiibacteriota bacterium]|nr:MAG: CoA-binding protein [candidate division Zixibacteria bacterium]
MPRGNNQKSPSSWSNPGLIREILEESRTVAVVGLSDKTFRPSHDVARFLIEHGYHVVGVNPNVDEILGAICYPTLAEVPEPIDVVCVFRRPEAVDAVVSEVIRLKIPYLWLQIGVVDEAAAQRAHEAGVKVVMNRCMKLELERQ